MEYSLRDGRQVTHSVLHRARSHYSAQYNAINVSFSVCNHQQEAVFKSTCCRQRCGGLNKLQPDCARGDSEARRDDGVPFITDRLNHLSSEKGFNVLLPHVPERFVHLRESRQRRSDEDTDVASFVYVFFQVERMKRK